MPDRPVSSLAARTCRGVLLAAFATALTACAPHRTFEDEVFSANRAVRDAVSRRELLLEWMPGSPAALAVSALATRLLAA